MSSADTSSEGRHANTDSTRSEAPSGSGLDVDAGTVLLGPVPDAGAGELRCRLGCGGSAPPQGRRRGSDAFRQVGAGSAADSQASPVRSGQPGSPGPVGGDLRSLGT